MGASSFPTEKERMNQSVAVSPDIRPDSTKWKGFEGLTIRSIDDPLVGDRRFYWIRTDHYYLNYPYEALCLNGEYVQSYIGLSRDSLNHYLGWHLWPSEAYERKWAAGDSLYCFHGIGYRSVCNIVCPKYKPRLVSLSDLMQTYAPEVEMGSCLFTIDGRMLTRNLHGFRFDADYIKSVRVYPIRTIPMEQGSEPASHPLALDLYHVDIRTKSAPPATSVLLRGDKEEMSYLLSPNDRERVNQTDTVYFLNGKPIVSYAGIDIEGLKHSGAQMVRLGKKTKKDTHVGMDIQQKKYRPRLISLQELLDKYYPPQGRIRLHQRYAFWINDVAIDPAIGGLSIDEDFIHTVQIFEAPEPECFGGGWHRHKQLDLVVVRIYTKNESFRLKENLRGRIR